MSSTTRRVDSYKYLSPASTRIVQSLIARAQRETARWTPLRRPLSGATVSLVSTAGISLKGDPPFDAQGERRNPWWGDPSYRVIPRTAIESDIVVSHLHIEPAYLYDDLNVALPLARLA